MGNGYDDLLEVVYNHHPKDLSNSLTFVGFFVCGKMGRFKCENNTKKYNYIWIITTGSGNNYSH